MRIVFYLTDISNQYQMGIYQGVARVADKLNIQVLCIQGKTLDIHQIIQKDDMTLLNSIPADGILFMSAAIASISEIDFDKENFRRNKKNLPCVSIGYRIPGIPSVLVSTKDSMQKLMDHLLIEHNYRHFLFVSGPEKHNDSRIRELVVKGCIKNTKEATLDVIRGDWFEQTANDLMKQYAETHSQVPDAIICANDNTALGVMRYLHTVPGTPWEKCAVTGFDDIPPASLTIPPLTTIGQKLELMGENGIKLLYELMNGQKPEQTVYIDTKLKIRNSCGCDVKGSGDTDASVQYKEYHELYLQKMKSEEMLSIVKTFAEELAAVDDLKMFQTYLKNFVDRINLEDFTLFLFASENNKHLITEELPSGYAGMIYCRKNYKDFDCGTGIKVNLSKFFSEECNKKVMCITRLGELENMTGFVIYTAPDSLQPHICSACSFLENTIMRIEMLNSEKTRALELENQVRLRTRDLQKSNNKLKKEAKKRMAVEAEVLKISELERLRFSMDLHDDICQRLAGISMYSKSLQHYGQIKTESVVELTSMIEDTLSRTRAYAHNFFPLELDTLGLREALESLCVGIENQTGCECIYTWKIKADDVFSIAQKMNIYRIMQEAMQNIIKHSKATVIKLDVSKKANIVNIILKDNGIGINISAKSKETEAKKNTGLGLRSMEYRAHQIGAEYRLFSKPGEGTSIMLKIPVKE